LRPSLATFIMAKQYRLLSYVKTVQSLCEQHDQTQKCTEGENSHSNGICVHWDHAWKHNILYANKWICA